MALVTFSKNHGGNRADVYSLNNASNQAKALQILFLCSLLFLFCLFYLKLICMNEIEFPEGENVSFLCFMIGRASKKILQWLKT